MKEKDKPKPTIKITHDGVIIGADTNWFRVFWAGFKMGRFFSFVNKPITITEIHRRKVVTEYNASPHRGGKRG